MDDKRLDSLQLFSCEKNITDSTDIDVTTKDWANFNVKAMYKH